MRVTVICSGFLSLLLKGFAPVAFFMFLITSNAQNTAPPPFKITPGKPIKLPEQAISIDYEARKAENVRTMEEIAKQAGAEKAEEQSETHAVDDKTAQSEDEGFKETLRIIENQFAYAKSSYYVLGKYIAIKHPGAKLLLVVDKPRNGDVRTPKMLEAFKKGLSGKAKIEAAETPEISQVNGRILKPEEIELMPLQEMLTADSFDRLVEKHPDCTLIVSFLGLPNDADKMKIWSMEPAKRPKIALVNGAYYNLKNVIQSGAVTAVVAVSPKAMFSDEPAPPNMKSAFDKRYLLITPDNVDEYAREYGGMFSK